VSFLAISQFAGNDLPCSGILFFSGILLSSLLILNRFSLTCLEQFALLPCFSFWYFADVLNRYSLLEFLLFVGFGNLRNMYQLFDWLVV
jgi:hypothetical protein